MTVSTPALLSTARRSLESNIIELSSGPYLSAGRNQFRGLWTRDFCFAVGGLLQLGQTQVVVNHLSALLRHQRPADGLVPRLMDSVSPAWLRVFWHMAGHWVPQLMRSIPLEDGLLPEYRSEHGIEAIDSNLLVLLASLAYVRRTGDTDWWARHERELVRAYEYYARFSRSGLITQPPYSDWQDSARRIGHTFYTNLLYQVATDRLSVYPAFGIEPCRAGRIRERLDAAFYDADVGLYRSVHRAPQFSLDGQLLALDLEYLDPASSAARAVFEALERHALWNHGDMPGSCTIPDYPRRDVSWQTQVAGLRDYHGRMRWSWLIALSAKVATRMGNATAARRILRKLEGLVLRDDTIYEIYGSAPPFLPWRTRRYASEADFSWGSAMVIEAVASAR